MNAEIEYFGDPGACDVCGRLLASETFFCDAQLSAQQDRWGMVCKTCTDAEGIRAGWGRAQFYERCETGKTGRPEDTPRWRCVAGHPPTEVLRD